MFVTKSKTGFFSACIGAGMMSALALAVSAPPVHASEARPGTVTQWAAEAGKQVDKLLCYPRLALSGNDAGDAAVALTVAPSGALVKAELVQSTGSALLDAEARRVASQLTSLPPLPAHVADGNKTVLVKLTFAAGPAETVTAKSEAKSETAAAHNAAIDEAHMAGASFASAMK